MRRLVVGHLFPDYLNIYADRGNIAVLSARAAWRGHELEVRPLGAGAEIQGENTTCSTWAVVKIVSRP